MFIREDAAATGMNYARSVGVIAGLVMASDLLEEIKAELDGRRDEDKERKQ